MRAPNSGKAPRLRRLEDPSHGSQARKFLRLPLRQPRSRCGPHGRVYPGVEEELRAFVPGIDGLRPLLVRSVEEDCNWKVVRRELFGVLPLPGRPSDLHERRGRSGRLQRHAPGALPQTYGKVCLPGAHVYAIDAARRHGRRCLRRRIPVLVPVAGVLLPGLSRGVLNTYLWRPGGTERSPVHRGWYTAGGMREEVIEKLAQQDLDTTVAEDVRLVNSVAEGIEVERLYARPPGAGSRFRRQQRALDPDAERVAAASPGCVSTGRHRGRDSVILPHRRWTGRARTGDVEVEPVEDRSSAGQRGEPKAGATWPDEIYRVLRDFDITQFAYVPDAGHKALIDRSLADPEVHSVALTTEEEGVGPCLPARTSAADAGCCSCSRAGSATASTSSPWCGAGSSRS